MSPEAPVLVTGTAAYSCCGLGTEAFWSRLAAGLGVNGAARSSSPRRFTPLEATIVSRHRRVQSHHRLAARLLAAIEHDLGPFLDGRTEEEKECIGVALGSAYAHLGSYFHYYQTGTERGYQCVNPRHFPFTLPNSCTVEVNDAYSLWGSSTTVGSGWAAGLEAIGYAAALIARGQEQAMLAGGIDELNDYSQKVLEAGQLGSPAGSVRPFAPDRDGTVAGEAVAVLLLQSPEATRAAGRESLAEVCGCTSVHGIRWDAPGARAKAAEAIRQTLDRAGVRASDIDAIFPSANGSMRGDEFEQGLLRDVFGERLGSIAIHSVKSAIGECFAAAGPLQCLAAVYAVALAPEGSGTTIRLSNNGSCLLLADQIGRRATALVYTAGYDGTFSALVVRRPTA